MKKLFSVLAACLLAALPMSQSLWAEAWTIRSVDFDPQGGTKVSALKRKIKVDTEKVFESKEELDAYVVSIKQKLINERLFETIQIDLEEDQQSGEQAEGARSATLKVATVDSRHFLFLPYPKYDSNEGFEFKVKLKDDNFLGLMNPLSSDVFVQWEQKENKSDDFVAGASLKYQLPFAMGPIQASWNNELFFKYAFIRQEPEWNLKTGFTFIMPFKNLDLRLDLTQGFVRDADYKVFDDELYWTENAKFSVPIVLERFEKIGNLVYTPAAQIDCKWDLDGINPIDEDLLSPRLIFSHGLSLGQVNWIGNFRKGFYACVEQSAAYNFKVNEFQPGVKVTANIFAAWKHLGLNSRFLLFAEKNTYTRYGYLLRGVADDQYLSGVPHTPNGYSAKGAAAMVLNLDLPIKVFSTDWESWGAKWLRSFNFEVQIVPFIDIALAANRMTGRVFDPRDGFYCAGIEVLLFPQKWKSVQIRASAGFDIGRLLLKDFIDTSWRDEKSSKKELTIGIGLFY